MLPKSFDEYLVDLYRGWHAMEHSRHGNSIIDFDLAPAREFQSAQDRTSVLSDIENAAADLAGETGKFELLVRARLTASAAYLRSLLGQKIAFRPYIKQTLNIEPRLFSEDEIRRQRVILEEALWEHYNIRFGKSELPRFRGRFMVYDKKQLPSQFEAFRATWVPILLERISVPLSDYKVNVEFASEDAYWKNWISGNLANHEIVLRINVHPRQSWYQGFPETLVIHEYCGHAVQMINWHMRIEKKQLPQFLGILTVHFPDQFLLEGLAESLVFVLPGKQRLEKESLVSRELHRYYLLVMNNAHIIANENGPEIAAQFAVVNLPFTAPEVIGKEMHDRTQNPLFRTYQYVYGIAKESFLATLGQLDFTQSWNLLRSVYDCPMTASQFLRASTSPAKSSNDEGRTASWANLLQSRWKSGANS